MKTKLLPPFMPALAPIKASSYQGEHYHAKRSYFRPETSPHALMHDKKGVAISQPLARIKKPVLLALYDKA